MNDSEHLLNSHLNFHLRWPKVRLKLMNSYWQWLWKPRCRLHSSTHLHESTRVLSLELTWHKSEAPGHLATAVRRYRSIIQNTPAWFYTCSVPWVGGTQKLRKAQTRGHLLRWIKSKKHLLVTWVSGTQDWSKLVVLYYIRRNADTGGAGCVLLELLQHLEAC